METIDPNARVADLIGLLYVLMNTFRGRTDLYQLEKELEVDLDDLMPIVYSASALGMITVGEGDIIITDLGMEFISSGIRKRKDILRERLPRIEPFHTALNLKRFSVEELMEKLQEEGVSKFNSPSGKHDLEVILNEWGVYSGLLRRSEDIYELA
ncbi:ABC transporter ATP-binding protein [Sulfolobales archaeon HS-7]|nr:ABC transporter ATP-binding protein [Sulfolobales archaeon HS-7]